MNLGFPDRVIRNHVIVESFIFVMSQLNVNGSMKKKTVHGIRNLCFEVAIIIGL